MVKPAAPQWLGRAADGSPCERGQCRPGCGRGCAVTLFCSWGSRLLQPARSGAFIGAREKQLPWVGVQRFDLVQHCDVVSRGGGAGRWQRRARLPCKAAVAPAAPSQPASTSIILGPFYVGDPVTVVMCMLFLWRGSVGVPTCFVGCPSSDRGLAGCFPQRTARPLHHHGRRTSPVDWQRGKRLSVATFFLATAVPNQTLTYSRCLASGCGAL